MPLFQMNLKDSKMTAIAPQEFANVNVSERADLQRLLRDNPAALEQALDEKVFIFSEEYSNWKESERRVDLLALDKGNRTEDSSVVTANLVVIELKVAEGGGHMELQSIRYAAMLSNMSFDAIAEAYERFSKKPAALVRTELLKFLEDPELGQIPEPEQVRISKKPRIILVSPSFSKEITTTVLWLNENGLDVKCLEATPYKIGADIYLDLEQVIPLPQAQEYMVQRREKTLKEEKQATNTKGERTIPMLVARGILKLDDRVRLIKLPRPNLEISDEKARHGTFTDGQKIRWDYDGQDYSLSGLCKKICELFGGDSGSGAFQGPLYWAKEGDNKSLAEIAWSLDSQPPVADDGKEK